MKKVIKGKLYNTETAKVCGFNEPNPNQGDLTWFRETLYQKKNGEFFLFGDGNANSRYSRSCGQNEWCGDEKIIPLTYTEALVWGEEHLTGDKYEEIFGEIAEDDDPVQIHISMTRAEAEIIKRRAAQEGMNVSAYIVHRCTE